MIIDARRDAPAAEPYDICIIGAGAAGISLALQFESTRARVCLLEAGGMAYDRAGQARLAGEFRGHGHAALRDTRLAAFGGTTRIWAGWCRPLDDDDFAVRPWCSSPGWPIRPDEMRGFYELAHEVCGLGAFEYDPGRLAGAIVDDTLIDDGEFFTPQVFHIRALDFGQQYRERIQRAVNIDAWLRTPVTRLIMNQSARVVDGAEVILPGGRSVALRARCIILACGGIENARILLLSGESCASAPGNQNDLVGRYFTDHPFVNPGTLVLHGAERRLDFFRPQSNGKTAKVRGVLSLCDEVTERDGLMKAALFVLPRYESHPVFESPEVGAMLDVWARLSRRSVPGEVGRDILRALRRPYRPVLALARKLFVADGASRRWRLRAMFETQSRPDNRVTLSDETDDLGRRVARVEWRLGDADIENMRRVISLFETSLQRAGTGHLERAFGDDPAAWVDAVESGKHHIGTTRMHEDPRRGVVDSTCRVHGVSNLYVAGSSVFPSPGYANPTLTIVALALRLADHLKQNRDF